MEDGTATKGAVAPSQCFQSECDYSRREQFWNCAKTLQKNKTPEFLLKMQPRRINKGDRIRFWTRIRSGCYLPTENNIHKWWCFFLNSGNPPQTWSKKNIQRMNSHWDLHDKGDQIKILGCWGNFITSAKLQAASNWVVQPCSESGCFGSFEFVGIFWEVCFWNDTKQHPKAIKCWWILERAM